MDPDLLEKLDILLTRQSAISAEASDLSDLLKVQTNALEPLLDRLVEEGVFQDRVVTSCAQCKEELDEDALREAACDHCHVEFGRRNEPRVARTYTWRRARNRHIGWLVAIHGMNSPGEWQEQLQWLIDLTFPASRPFANVKLGKIVFSVFFRALQKKKLENFHQRLKLYIDGTPERLRNNPPDIIAHSFGTWLLGHELLRHPDVRVGHVILVGSILRPDFDWATILGRGQATGVLNNYGTRDKWASVAEIGIPDSGPSGWKGFLPSSAANVFNVPEDIDHSDFFEKDLEERWLTIWRPFLQDQAVQIESLHPIHADNPGWKRLSPFKRYTSFPLALYRIVKGVSRS